MKNIRIENKLYTFPDPPDENYEAKIVKKKPTWVLSAKKQNDQIKQEILALENGQHRALREYVLNPKNKDLKDKIQKIDDEITKLRTKLQLE